MRPSDSPKRLTTKLHSLTIHNLEIKPQQQTSSCFQKLKVKAIPKLYNHEKRQHGYKNL